VGTHASDKWVFWKYPYRRLEQEHNPARAGQKLAYVYFEDERADERQPRLLTRDEARPLRSVFEGGQDCKSRFHSSRPVLMN